MTHNNILFDVFTSDLAVNRAVIVNIILQCSIDSLDYVRTSFVAFPIL